MFKKGDRVRKIVHSGDGPSVGSVGTVLEEKHTPYVSWDNWQQGHNECLEEWDLPYSSWAECDDDLELVKEDKGEKK